MTEKKASVYTCDLCGDWSLPLPGLPEGWSRFSTEDQVFDVCKECVDSILESLGIFVTDTTTKAERENTNED